MLSMHCTCLRQSRSFCCAIEKNENQHKNACGEENFLVLLFTIQSMPQRLASRNFEAF